MKRYIFYMGFLFLLSSCGYDQEGSRKYFESIYGFDKCGNPAHIECLQTVGWTFKQVTLEGAKDSLDINTNLDTIAVSDTTSLQSRKLFRMAATEFIGYYHLSDEIYFFNTPPVTWETLCGQQGYLIRNQDSLVAYIKTIIN